MNLFKAFDKADKGQILEKIDKDLKGKPFEDLKWLIENDIQLDPIHFAEDIQANDKINRTDNAWLIGSSFKGDDIKLVNKAILDELVGGLELIQIHINNDNVEQLPSILEKVFLSMVSCSFILDNEVNVTTFIITLKSICLKQELSPDRLTGNIYFHSNQENSIQQILGTFTNLNLLIPFQNTGNITQDLANQMDQAVQCLHHEKLAPALNFSKIEFQQSIGNLFLFEISKLRAMQLLWMNVQNNYPVEIVSIQIEAHVDVSSQKEDMYTNMIQTSAQSMAAVIGGVKSLITLPSNAKEGANSFSRRIARNVQHIMKLESFLNRVDDPSSGSYSIETLTKSIANTSWENFIKK